MTVGHSNVNRVKRVVADFSRYKLFTGRNQPELFDVLDLTAQRPGGWTVGCGSNLSEAAELTELPHLLKASTGSSEFAFHGSNPRGLTTSNQSRKALFLFGNFGP